MRVAAVQYRPPKGEPERARHEIVALVEDAASQGAGLVVLPELATTGYIWRSANEILPHTEDAQGPTFRLLSQLARRHEMWIVCGFAERVARPGAPGIPSGRDLFNSAMVIDAQGGLAACYRKVLLYEADTTWAIPGWQRTRLDAPFGRVVPGICMDLNDDGFIDHLRQTRPTVVPFCTNWLEEGLDVHAYWRWRLQGVGGWFVAANCWGVDEGTRFAGRSAILSPDGRVVAEAGRYGDDVLAVDID